MEDLRGSYVNTHFHTVSHELFVMLVFCFFLAAVVASRDNVKQFF